MLTFVCRLLCVFFIWSNVAYGSELPLQNLFQRSAEANRQASSQPTGPAIAHVNGEPISRAEFARILYASAGTRILTQQIALTAARQAARAEGINVADREFQAELDRILAEMGPAVDATGKKLTRDDQRRILRYILKRRQISYDEFILGVRRQTYLRAVAEKRIKTADIDMKKLLQEEYQLRYGPRRRLRVIVSDDLERARMVWDKLRSGQEFTKLARQYSTDVTTASRGGDLGVAARNDKRVPAIVRDVVFDQLSEGAFSSPIKVGTQFWIIRVDKVIPAEPVPFDSVKDELTRSVSEKLTGEMMARIDRTMLLQSKVKIPDRQLDAGFRNWRTELEQSKP